MFKRKSYIYHVAYFFKNQKMNGDGSITITRNKKIKTSEDVKGIAEYIGKEHGMGLVCISNWIRLKG